MKIWALLLIVWADGGAPAIEQIALGAINAEGCEEQATRVQRAARENGNLNAYATCVWQPR